MTPQLSPESLEQIRQNVQEAIGGVERRLEAHDERFDAIERRFDAMDQRFDAMDQRVDALQTESREGLAENRRHFGVLHEDLRDQIRLIAEGFATTNERIDRLEIGMHTEFARVDGRLRRLEAERPRRRRPPKR